MAAMPNAARTRPASKGRGNTEINNELCSSLSRKRITVSMQYRPKTADSCCRETKR